MPEVIVKGTKIHYVEKKSRTSSPHMTVLFIHGSGGNAGVWRRVMEGLAEGCDSVAVDLPGHGESEGQGMQSIPEYREFLKDFFYVLGTEKIVLGGHSLGGGIAQDFALRYPQKLRAILLIGTGARLRVLPEALEILGQMAEGKTEPRFEPWGFSPRATPELLSEGEREWAKTSPRVRYYDMAACDRFDIMKEVDQIRLPALVVCGREDRLTPVKYSEYLKAKIPGSKLEIIEGAGHMVMLEAPEALSPMILAFLRSLTTNVQTL